MWGLGQRSLQPPALLGSPVHQHATVLLSRPASVRCPPQAAQKLRGTVITVMNKTVNVEVVRLAPHPKYVKRIRKIKKFMAHDEENACQLGDFVELLPDRPRSKLKRWQVGQILVASQI